MMVVLGLSMMVPIFRNRIVEFVFFVKNKLKWLQYCCQNHIYPELGTILLDIVPNSGHICANICGNCPELGAYM